MQQFNRQHSKVSSLEMRDVSLKVLEINAYDDVILLFPEVQLRQCIPYDKASIIFASSLTALTYFSKAQLSFWTLFIKIEVSEL